MLPARIKYYKQFMHEYAFIHNSEGRGSQTPDYFRALPFRDLSGLFEEDWRIRGTSFKSLLKYVIEPLEARRQRELVILDVGAGNGWLSSRLARRGHLVAAVDLLDNEFDGLGAHVHYDEQFIPIQAAFEHLPVIDFQIDAVIFNASLHYATNYEVVLKEALRVVRGGGQVAVMDTPVYHDQYSGEKMVLERQSYFKERFGLPSNSIPSENYITNTRITELGESVGINWKIIKPFYGLRWSLRPVVSGLRNRREPAKFHLLIGERV